MMQVSTALKNHLAGTVTTLATLWRVTRVDGVVMGFTDHDQDITFDGQLYKAATGFTPTALSSSAALAVDNLEIQSVLDADDITEEDLSAGLYDGATVDVFLVNYADLSAGCLYPRRGTIGEVKVSDHGFAAELRGMVGAYSANVGQVYSPTCRADFGDDRCGVSLRRYSVAGTVTAVTDHRRFTDSGRTEDSGWFTHGLLTWTSGANAGRAMEVKSYGGGVFQLFLPMRSAIQPGDHYTVHAGCNRTHPTCKTKFGNIVNFRGEPHVPGNDFLIRAADKS